MSPIPINAKCNFRFTQLNNIASRIIKQGEDAFIKRYEVNRAVHLILIVVVVVVFWVFFSVSLFVKSRA